MRRASSANQRNWSIDRPHSRPDWAIGLPVSSEIIAAASSVRRFISSAMACNASARSKADFAFHAANPAAAEAIAASVSATDATGTCPKGRSDTGLNTGAVRPSMAAVQRPSTKSPNLSYISACLVDWGPLASHLAERGATCRSCLATFQIPPVICCATIIAEDCCCQYSMYPFIVGPRPREEIT